MKSLRTHHAAVALLVVLSWGMSSCGRQLVAPRTESSPGPHAAAASDVVVQRPLSDFLSQQGTTDLFVPPVPDYVGWFSDPARPPIRLAFVDYAGIEGKWIQDHGGPALGTTVSGTLTERPLPDGRAEVSLVLHTRRAQTWVIPFDLEAFQNGDIGQLSTAPVLFGHRAAELVADASLEPGLSVCDMVWVFDNTAPGAPLPDLVNAFLFGNVAPGQELIRFSIRANGSGPLRAAFGVEEGTPGRSVVSQTGILMASFKGALADGAPAELVDLHVVGGGGDPADVSLHK